jgi:hypothetical protein
LIRVRNKRMPRCPHCIRNASMHRIYKSYWHGARASDYAVSEMLKMNLWRNDHGQRCIVTIKLSVRHTSGVTQFYKVMVSAFFYLDKHQSCAILPIIHFWLVATAKLVKQDITSFTTNYFVLKKKNKDRSQNQVLIWYKNAKLLTKLYYEGKALATFREH